MQLDSVFRNALRFIFGTSLSRILGLIRDVVMSFSFGATVELASFMVAYRFANLFRRLLGEGPVQASLIPLLERKKQESALLAYAFYRKTLWSYSVLLGSITLLLGGLFFFLGQVFNEEWALVFHYATWMAPSLGFIGLYAVHGAFLQSEGKYFLFAAAPALFNLVWIGMALLASQQSEGRMQWLSFGIVLAFMSQSLFSFFATVLAQPKGKKWHVPFREVVPLFRPMLLSILGASALQMNSLLDAFFAKIADPQGPAFLWYALRVAQLPVSLFGVAISSALLPALSRLVQSPELYQERLRKTLLSTLYGVVPVFFGLLALASSGLNLLYGRGHFSSQDVGATLGCLFGYAPSLIPSVGILILSTGFYAKTTYSKPMVASLVAVASNMLVNSLLIFYFQLGAMSIALATSISAWINVLLLYFWNKPEPFSQDALLKKVFLGSFFGWILVEVVMGQGLVAYLSGTQLPFPRDFFTQCMNFLKALACYLLGGGSFILFFLKKKFADGGIAFEE